MSNIYLIQRQYEKAIIEGEKAVAFAPNNSRAHIFLAGSLHYAGRPKEAIVHIKKAMRFEPFYPAWFLVHSGGSYEMLGQYEEAIETWEHLLERALKGEIWPLFVHERLVINYMRIGQKQKAKAHKEEIMKINPKYSVEYFRTTTPYKDNAYLDSLVELLRNAGLPD
jgi:adenylate cyclase